MKSLLFFISGGLVVAWFLTRKCKKTEDAKKPGAAITDIVVPEVPASNPIMPSTMINKFDASEMSTVAPPQTTIQKGVYGAGYLDDVNLNSAYVIAD